MKPQRYIMSILTMILPLVMMGQGSSGDFDPTNPGDPISPSALKTITLKSVPQEGGRVYPSVPTRYEVGTDVTIYAEPANSYRFLRWEDTNGNAVSSDMDYTFIMPDKNMELNAIFEYDPTIFNPSNPGDPDVPSDQGKERYALTINVNPIDGGSFSVSGAPYNWQNGKRVTETSDVTVYAAASEKYRFVNWTDEDGREVGSDQGYSFVMPSREVTLTANFERYFNPGNPGDPDGSEIDNLLPITQPTFSFRQRQIHIATSFERANIRYTLDGTEPTDSTGFVYEGPFLPESNTCTIKAISVREGYKSSETAIFEYDHDDWKTPSPIYHSEETTLIIECSEPEARIYYNEGYEYPLDSNYNPVNGAKLYESSVSLTRNGEFCAVAITDDLFPSDMLQIKIDHLTVPDANIYYYDRKIHIASNMDGSIVRYTLDGTEPTEENGIIYSAPFLPNANCTIKAVAFFDGWNPSGVSSFEYSRQAHAAGTPTFTRVDNQLSISSATHGAAIYYIEGNRNPLDSDFNPISGAILYNSPITLTKNTTFSAVSITDGLLPSDLAVFVVDDFALSGVEITYSKRQLHISSEFEDAMIRYTLDGTQPTEENGSVYDGPFLPEYDCTVKAAVFREGYNHSDVTSYNFVREEHTVGWFLFTPDYENLELTVTAENNLNRNLNEDTFIINGQVVSIDSSEFTPMTIKIGEYDTSRIICEWKSEELLEREPAYFDPKFASEPTVSYDGKGVLFSYETEHTQKTIVTYDNGEVMNSTDLIEANGGLQFLPDMTCDIEYYAFGDGLFRTPKMHFPVHAIRFDEDQAVMLNEANWLEQSKIGEMASGWESLRIFGPINPAPLDNDDLNAIAGLQYLQSIDIADTKPALGTVADFSQLKNMMTIDMPAQNADSCQWNLDRIEKLSAIRWNSAEAMPEHLLSQIVNPNALIYTGDINLVPSTAANVVCNGSAERISLSAGFPFRVMEEFTAAEAVLVKNFSKETIVGKSKGWETIVVPFDVDRIMQTGEKTRDILPFSAIALDDYTTAGFWLATSNADASRWYDAALLSRGMPYIIAMPNSSEYIDQYNIRGDVSFIGHDVTVSDEILATGYTDEAGIHRVFSGNYSGIPAEDPVFALIEEEDESVFALTNRDVLPFECYFDGRPGMCPIRIGQTSSGVEMTTTAPSGITFRQMGSDLMITSSSDTSTSVATLTGTILHRLNLSAGEPFIIHDLTPGIYIVAGKKLMIK